MPGGARPALGDATNPASNHWLSSRPQTRTLSCVGGSATHVELTSGYMHLDAPCGVQNVLPAEPPGLANDTTTRIAAGLADRSGRSAWPHPSWRTILRSSMHPRDTSRAIQERMDAAYRRMSPTEKIRRMAALTGLAHSLALARIRAEHPHESPRQHRLRLAARWLSREQLRSAFGWTDDCFPDSP